MTSVQNPPSRKDRKVFEDIVRDPCRVERFVDEPVPREDVEQMVGLATFSASACNAQSWRFIAIEDRGLIHDMQTAVLERFEELASLPGLALQEQKRMVARAQALQFAKAPLCIAVLSLPVLSPMEELMELSGMTPEEHERLCAHPELQSVGAAVQLLHTAAHTMGYATCWTCAPIVAGERLEKLLGVERPVKLVALLPIGRPAGALLAHKRVPLEKVLSFR